MGFSPRWAARKMPEIEEFCELEDWFDRPVWMYSSGMMARLGFAVAINVEADVLLIDEVLGVGDLTFQAKSMMAMDKVLKSDATIILVSHGLTHIKRICSRAMLLDKGIVIAQGGTEDVLDKYYQEGTGEVVEQRKNNIATINESNGELRINDIIVMNEKSEITDRFRQTEKITFRICIEVIKEITSPLGMGFTIKSLDGVSIVHLPGKIFSNQKLSKGIYWLDIIPDFLPLTPGIFSLSCLIANGEYHYRAALVDNITVITVLSREGQSTALPNSAFFELTGKVQFQQEKVCP